MASGRYLLLLSCIFVACRQPEKPAADEASPKPGVGDSKQLDSNRSAAVQHECVVAMSETPAAPAQRAEHCPVAGELAPALPIGQVVFDGADQKPRVEVELARTDASRERGLMYRTRLDENSGMLFSWDDESPRTFWMHNTCIPLDMLFISKANIIAGVLEQVPVLNDFPRGVPCPAAHVLEVNAGWVREHGVKPGQHLTIMLP